MMIKYLTNIFIAVVISAVVFPALGAPKKDSVKKGKNVLFGLVIGSNKAHHEGAVPLRYADDDAVKNAALLKQLGATVLLLADLDRDSKRLYGQVDAMSPNIASVYASIGALNRLMDAESKKGNNPILFVFLSGHGDVAHGEGYIQLADKRFGRDDLIALIKGSKAKKNHIIIDACKSYFMVFNRGPGGSRETIDANIVKEESLPDNTGVFLSTSSDRDSHEWEAYQSGIFSHELRSALRGAADLNGDRAISYNEAAAFIWSANKAIANRKYRPNFFAKSPENANQGKEILVYLDDVQGDKLYVGPGIDKHTYLEDGDGQRLLDFHPHKLHRLVIVMPTRRPLFVRQPVENNEFEIPVGSEIHLAGLAPKRSNIQHRGAEHVAFKQLFSQPFGYADVAGYLNAPTEIAMPVDRKRSRRLNWVRRGFGISSIPFAVSGIFFNTMALSKKLESENEDATARHIANKKIDSYNTAAVVSYCVAGAFLGTYLVWTLMPTRNLNLQVAAGPNPQMQLSVTF